MIERTRQDSGRDLLEELEDGWGTPRAPSVASTPAAAPLRVDAPSSAERDEDGDGAVSEAKVDEGWLDDLFPGGNEEDDDEEEEEEPELPDERVDPVAFAAAKKARDERATSKKERRKVRADAKRARQRARAEAMNARQKQKSKKSRAATPSPRSVRAAAKAERAPTRVATAPLASGKTDLPGPEIRAIGRAPSAGIASGASTGKPSTVGSIKLLAIVLAVLLALAAVAAALMK